MLTPTPVVVVPVMSTGGSLTKVVKRWVSVDEGALVRVPGNEARNSNKVLQAKRLGP